MIIHHISAKQFGRKQLVAAHCRVSSSCASQEESFATQKKYYGLYIRGNPDWDAAGIYSDEGITGTSVQKRPGFRQMISDALDGKMDIILVKSISRFSRNAVECQRYVRLLKEHQVQIIFKEEGIDSMNLASDLIFNIRSTFAQEESRIISENVRWTYRKNFENGIYHRGNNRVLRYDEIDGELVPNAGAEKVCFIFRMFADGASLLEICRELRNQGVKRLRSGKEFDSATLVRMLRNELYVGECQKGRSGNGCKCRTVKEEALKAEIAAFLKWESFDEKCFSEQVKKLWIGRAGIHIETDKVFLETIG